VNGDWNPPPNLSVGAVNLASHESEIPNSLVRSSRSIQEFRIDFFLEEEFTVDINFVRAFVAAACKDTLSVKCVEYVRHSVSDKYGEADLVVLTTAALPSGHVVKLALLIEDKINAGFQPSQPQRYRQRGEEGVSSGRWDSFLTVLVAPAAYMTLSHGFDAAVSLEQISKWICPHDAERRAFKVGKIEEAIKKQGTHGVQTVDHDMTAFRIAYYEYLQTFNSQRGTDFTMRAPAPTYWGDNWFVLKSASLPMWVQLRHMAQTGNIEIDFRDVDFAKSDRLAELLEGDMVHIPTGKYKQHVTVRLPTPQILRFDSFERDRSKVDAALLSAERLWRLYLEKRTEFEAILVPARRVSGIA
jgi:hypothetical protein